MIARRLRRRPRRQHLRAQRPHRRLALLSRRSSPGSQRLQRWLVETRRPDEPLVVGGDFNVAPDDADVWDPRALPRRHARLAARARGVRATAAPGASSTPTAGCTPSPSATRWWDYRAGMFHKNYGMRIDHLLVTQPLAERVVWAEIDREARKGKPIPSDHAPVVIDLDEPGRAIDAGWAGATARIAARRK